MIPRGGETGGGIKEGARSLMAVSRPMKKESFEDDTSRGKQIQMIVVRVVGKGSITDINTKSISKSQEGETTEEVPAHKKRTR